MDHGTGSARGLSASSRPERTCVVAALSGELDIARSPGSVSEAIRAEPDIAASGLGELLTAHYDPWRGFAGKTFDTLGASRHPGDAAGPHQVHSQPAGAGASGKVQFASSLIGRIRTGAGRTPITRLRRLMRRTLRQP